MATGKKSLPVYPNCPKVDERICPICNEKAPKGEVHSPHYGGICCYSCRAFFRRAHQKTKTPKLRCKQDGNCPIAPKGQLRCKKCRYEKCLANGMSSKYVLTGDEKKIRFRNYFKKKGDLKKAEEEEEEPDNLENGEDDLDETIQSSNNNLEKKILSDSQGKPKESSLQERESLPARDQSSRGQLLPTKGMLNPRNVTDKMVKSDDINPATCSSTQNMKVPSRSDMRPIEWTPKAGHSPLGPELSKIKDVPQRSSLGTSRCVELPRTQRNCFVGNQVPVDLTEKDPFYPMTYQSERIPNQARYNTLYNNLPPTFSYTSESQPVSGIMAGSCQSTRQTQYLERGEMGYFSLEHEYHPRNQDLMQTSSQLIQVKKQSGQVGSIRYPSSSKFQDPHAYNYGNTPKPLNLSGSASPKPTDNFGSTCDQSYFSGDLYGQQFDSCRVKATLGNPFQYQSCSSTSTVPNYPASGYPVQLRSASPYSPGSDLTHMENNISGGYPLGESTRPSPPHNKDLSSLPIPAYIETYNLNFIPKKIKSENLYLNGGFENQLDSEARFSCWKEKPPAVMETIHSFSQPGSSLGDPVPLFSINAQLSHILDSFTLTTGKLCLNTDLINELIFNHQRKAPLRKQTLVNILGQITSMLTDFASSLYLFSSLCQEDQIVLLKNNVPLYIQYVLAKYFSASNGLEQLTWILEGQVPIESVDEVQRLSRLGLKEYNNSLTMFLTSEEAELYSYHCQNVGLFYPFPQHCNGLVANLILFHTNDTLSEYLQEPKRILCVYNEAKRLVRAGFEQLDQALEVNASQNIGPLIHTLHKMKSIFGNWKLQSDVGPSVKPPYHLAVSYTDAEEGWLKNRLAQFQGEYLSVGFTSEYLDPLIQLLSKGIPVKENFLGMWMSVSAERTLRILKMHPEFENLRLRDQDTLWRQNFRFGLAIMAAKVEGLKTGKDQLKSILGHFDPKDNSWEADFTNRINLDNLKVVYLVDSKLNLGKLDKESVDLYNRTLKDLTPIIENEQNFQLFMILSLLNPEEISNVRDFADITRVRQFYLKLFQRKLYSTGYSYIDYAKFRNALNKVKTFASLLEKCG